MAFSYEITRGSLRQPAHPILYKHLLQTDESELVKLAESGVGIRLVSSGEISPKAECEQLWSQYAADLRHTGTICLFNSQPGLSCNHKRQRTSVDNALVFPSKDRSGTKINSGYGGDFSFLPGKNPIICKLSCKFIAEQQGSCLPEVKLHSRTWQCPVAKCFTSAL